MQALEMVGRAVRLVERDAPVPGRGEVAVRVKACGANASDWEFITGRPLYGRIARVMMRVRVPGSDVAGVVEAVGDGVSGVAVGDRVVADVFESFGGFAEVCVAKAERWVKLPDEIGFVEAAALPQSAAIAITAFDDLAPGAKVLVNGGGGGSGPYAIQLAKARGAEVWAVDNTEKQGVMRKAGADHVIDYTQTDFATLELPLDYVLDLWSTRSPRTLRRRLPEGCLYRMVGGSTGLVIRHGLRGQILMVKQGPVLTARAVALVQDGTWVPHIGEVVPLVQGPEALARMGAGQIPGKLVFTIS